MNYYVARNGQQFGPYTEETVRSYVAAGSLFATDNIRAESSQTWTTIGQLFQIPQTAPMVAQPQVAPQYAQAPQYGQTPQYIQAAPGGGIMPPNLHWALLLLLCITYIFPFIWAIRQGAFAKKIDPSSSAMWGFVLWMACSIGGFWMNMSVIMGGGVPTNTGLPMLLGVGALVCYEWGSFGTRKAMETYYNSVEPIQLKMSGVLTFFLGIFYLQYHMSRIARWKTTGVLSA